MEFHEVGRTLLEVLHEETLGIVEFHEVGRTFLEVLHEETLGIVLFHEVGRNLLEVLHEETLNIYILSITSLQEKLNKNAFRYVLRIYYPNLF